MFKPKLNVEYTGDLVITDTTGLYSPTNKEGWGAPNLERANVTANLLIYLNGKLQKSMNVTDTVNAATGETIVFNSEGYGDGIYKVFYRLNGEVYDYGALCFVHDKLLRDLSVLWAYLATLYDSYRYRDFANECIFIDSHERQLNTLRRRGSEKKYLALLRIAQERVLINLKKIEP